VLPDTPHGGTHLSVWQVPRFFRLGYTEKVAGSTQRADVSIGLSMQKRQSGSLSQACISAQQRSRMQSKQPAVVADVMLASEQAAAPLVLLVLGEGLPPPPPPFVVLLQPATHAHAPTTNNSALDQTLPLPMLPIA